MAVIARLPRCSITCSPAQVVDMVKDSGLRGRGGAGYPCGLKWTFLPHNHPGPIYLCVNADESEPCTFNNRILMEEDPASGAGGHLAGLLRHASQHGVLLHPLRIRQGRPRFAAGDR